MKVVKILDLRQSCQSIFRAHQLFPLLQDFVRTGVLLCHRRMGVLAAGAVMALMRDRSCRGGSLVFCGLKAIDAVIGFACGRLAGGLGIKGARLQGHRCFLLRDGAGVWFVLRWRSNERHDIFDGE